jgi:hypothetical protein
MEVEPTQYEVSDLVKYAYEGQPAKMQDVFNELMMGRLYDSIQQKKVEVAQRFFGTKDELDQDADQDNNIEDIEDTQDGQVA